MELEPRTMVAILLAGSTLLQGCGAVVATGVVTGAAVAHDRRTAGTIVDDQSIEIKVQTVFYDEPDLSEGVHINVTSYNGIVLLSGETPTEAQRRRAEERVAGIEGVRLVHNELTIAAPSSAMTRSSDSLITAKVKTKMLGDEGFDAGWVKVVTENGTVYLMGIVTRDEADRATEITRSTGGVQRVVRLFEYITPKEANPQADQPPEHETRSDPL